MRSTLFRVQDEEGRGPYRPGTSRYWADADHARRNPTFMEEFGQGVLNKLRHGEHCGCAFQNMQQAERWFSPVEIARLRFLRFRFVIIDPNRILARSERQTIFVCKLPLWIAGKRTEIWPHQQVTA